MDNLAPATDRPHQTDALFPVVYDELRRLATRFLNSESPGLTIQPTALVHEVYLRLIASGTQWNNTRHFYRTAAEAMRRILVDAARRRGSQKRGGDLVRQAIELDHISGESSDPELLDLNEALTAFAAIEPEIAELVNLRYFAGLSLKDAAEMIGFAPRTADANWAYARGWLLEFMRPQVSSDK
ncbi:MAG: ECF-type sigma factor [Gemmataceae bacterium]